MRRQTFLVVFVALAVFIMRGLVDPNGFAGALSWAVGIVSAVVLIAAWHAARKAYMDHTGASMKRMFEEASPDARLHAAAVMALALALLFAAASVHAQDVRTFVPPQARPYLPMVGDALNREWPQVPERAYIPALMEHESGCFSMPRKCWNPATELLTKREHGVGFSQFTVAYDVNGNVRFDKLAELSEHYPQLRALTWDTVKVRPDLQIEATVLGVRDLYRYFAGAEDAPQFTDAAWNGGKGDVNRERRACRFAPHCNPQKWFGNVELFCMKSHAALYGNRSPCDINRFHVRDVWARINKYRGLV